MSFPVVNIRNCRTNEVQQCLRFQCQAEASFLNRFSPDDEVIF